MRVGRFFFNRMPLCLPRAGVLYASACCLVRGTSVPVGAERLHYQRYRIGVERGAQGHVRHW
jgi:hypothetical protein